MLEESPPADVCHLIIMEDCSLQAHSSWMAQISAATAKTVIMPEVYNDFEDVFFTGNADHLLFH